MIHSFDEEVAIKFGIKAAVIYQHLVFRAKCKNTNVLPLARRELEAQYPYMSAKAIDLALKSLCKGTRKIRPLLQRTNEYQRAESVYYIDESQIPPETNAKHRYDSVMAEKHGIPCAIVYYNICYWIRRNWFDAADKTCAALAPEVYGHDVERMLHDSHVLTFSHAHHWMTAKKWAESHPYLSRATASRCFQDLQEAGLLVKEGTDGFVACWTLPAEALSVMMLSRTNEQFREKISQDFHGLKQHQVFSNRARMISKRERRSQNAPDQSEQVPDNKDVPSNFASLNSLLTASVLKKLKIIETCCGFSQRSKTATRMLAHFPETSFTEQELETLLAIQERIYEHNTASPSFSERLTKAKPSRAAIRLPWAPLKRGSAGPVTYRKFDPAEYDLEDDQVALYQAYMRKQSVSS